jgi:signal transduction histidine kinase
MRELPPEIDEPVRIIEEEAQQSQRIVDGMRDHIHPIMLNNSPVDLVYLVEDGVARMVSAGDGVMVQLITEAAPLRFFGDAGRLRQVIGNLLRNAVEASPADAEVRVRLFRAEGRVALSIADRGAGISEVHRERLFEPFFTTKARGVGLGLSISDAIVRAHGGQITVSNNAEGGATFTVFLPGSEENDSGAGAGRRR